MFKGIGKSLRSKKRHRFDFYILVHYIEGLKLPKSRKRRRKLVNSTFGIKFVRGNKSGETKYHSVRQLRKDSPPRVCFNHEELYFPTTLKFKLKKKKERSKKKKNRRRRRKKKDDEMSFDFGSKSVRLIICQGRRGKNKFKTIGRLKQDLVNFIKPNGDDYMKTISFPLSKMLPSQPNARLVCTFRSKMRTSLLDGRDEEFASESDLTSLSNLNDYDSEDLSEAIQDLVQKRKKEKEEEEMEGEDDEDDDEDISYKDDDERELDEMVDERDLEAIMELGEDVNSVLSKRRELDVSSESDDSDAAEEEGGEQKKGLVAEVVCGGDEEEGEEEEEGGEKVEKIEGEEAEPIEEKKLEEEPEKKDPEEEKEVSQEPSEEEEEEEKKKKEVEEEDPKIIPEPQEEEVPKPVEDIPKVPEEEESSQKEETSDEVEEKEEDKDIPPSRKKQEEKVEEEEKEETPPKAEEKVEEEETPPKAEEEEKKEEEEGEVETPPKVEEEEERGKEVKEEQAQEPSSEVPNEKHEEEEDGDDERTETKDIEEEEEHTLTIPEDLLSKDPKARLRAIESVMDENSEFKNNHASIHDQMRTKSDGKGVLRSVLELLVEDVPYDPKSTFRTLYFLNTIESCTSEQSEGEEEVEEEGIWGGLEKNHLLNLIGKVERMTESHYGDLYDFQCQTDPSKIYNLCKELRERIIPRSVVLEEEEEEEETESPPKEVEKDHTVIPPIEEEGEEVGEGEEDQKGDLAKSIREIVVEELKSAGMDSNGEEERIKDEEDEKEQDDEMEESCSDEEPDDVDDEIPTLNSSLPLPSQNVPVPHPCPVPGEDLPPLPKREVAPSERKPISSYRFRNSAHRRNPVLGDHPKSKTTSTPPPQPSLNRREISAPVYDADESHGDDDDVEEKDYDTRLSDIIVETHQEKPIIKLPQNGATIDDIITPNSSMVVEEEEEEGEEADGEEGSLSRRLFDEVFGQDTESPTQERGTQTPDNSKKKKKKKKRNSSHFFSKFLLGGQGGRNKKKRKKKRRKRKRKVLRKHYTYIYYFTDSQTPITSQRITLSKNSIGEEKKKELSHRLADFCRRILFVGSGTGRRWDIHLDGTKRGSLPLNQRLICMRAENRSINIVNPTKLTSPPSSQSKKGGSHPYHSTATLSSALPPALLDALGRAGFGLVDRGQFRVYRIKFPCTGPLSQQTTESKFRTHSILHSLSSKTKYWNDVPIKRLNLKRLSYACGNTSNLLNVSCGGVEFPNILPNQIKGQGLYLLKVACSIALLGHSEEIDLDQVMDKSILYDNYFHSVEDDSDQKGKNKKKKKKKKNKEKKMPNRRISVSKSKSEKIYYKNFARVEEMDEKIWKVM